MNSYNLTTKNPKQLNGKMAKGGASGFGECIHVPGGCGHLGSLGTEAPGPRTLLYSNLCTSSSGCSSVSFTISFTVNGRITVQNPSADSYTLVFLDRHLCHFTKKKIVSKGIWNYESL